MLQFRLANCFQTFGKSGFKGIFNLVATLADGRAFFARQLDQIAQMSLAVTFSQGRLRANSPGHL